MRDDRREGGSTRAWHSCSRLQTRRLGRSDTKVPLGVCFSLCFGHSRWLGGSSAGFDRLTQGSAARTIFRQPIEPAPDWASSSVKQAHGALPAADAGRPAWLQSLA
jgi:hypothetical protein